MGLGTFSLLAGWGFAEATIFFVVADVGISWIALRRGLKAGVAAALAASCGAVLGIALLHSWAVLDPATALDFVDAVPWVTPGLIEGMRAALAEKGALAVLEAGATGVPIKVGAVLAPEYGVNPAAFIVAGLAQRLARFTAAALLAAFVSRALRRIWPEPALVAVWAGFWLLFYAIYWVRIV
jgi:hypothetical protein